MGALLLVVFFTLTTTPHTLPLLIDAMVSLRRINVMWLNRAVQTSDRLPRPVLSVCGLNLFDSVNSEEPYALVHLSMLQWSDAPDNIFVDYRYILISPSSVSLYQYLTRRTNGPFGPTHNFPR